MIVSLSFDLRYNDRRNSWMWIGGKDGTKRANHSAFLGRGTSGYSVGFRGWFRRLWWIVVKPTKWPAWLPVFRPVLGDYVVILYSNSVFLDTVPATIETNKILANIFVPYVFDFLFLIHIAIVSESPSRDLLKSASYIEAIIVFLSLMNKKKKKETLVEKVEANAQKEFTVLNRPINIVAAALTRCTDAFLQVTDG